MKEWAFRLDLILYFLFFNCFPTLFCWSPFPQLRTPTIIKPKQFHPKETVFHEANSYSRFVIKSVTTNNLPGISDAEIHAKIPLNPKAGHFFFHAYITAFLP